MKKPTHGGGLQAISYVLKTAAQVGPLRLYQAMKSRNACKTCALGMGGQLGGMRNEAGHFPEFCKKSVQAMAADMRGKIDPAFFSKFTIRQLQAFSPREMESLGRLVTPIIALSGAAHYTPISWDDALTYAAGGLRAGEPPPAFFYASGRSSNEAGFLLQLFARVYGTNHVNNCSYYCHQASGAALTAALGTATATIDLADIDRCDTFILIGGNPSSNHPRLMASLMKLRRRGGRVVVINPVRETGLVNFRVPSDARSLFFGTEIASLYLQPAIGGDIALLSGLAKLLLESGRIDRAFIADYTADFDALAAHLAALTWDQIEQGSGITRADIQKLHDIYAASKAAIFGWTMGITHHQHGTANVHWIINAALLRGMLGRPGAGLLPIRGHSNVQGMGTIGVAPAVKKAVLERLDTLGIRPPAFAGLDTMGCIEASAAGNMQAAICLGGNLYGATPDATFTRAALGRLDLIAYLSTTLNTGHASGLAKGTLVLPVLARDEEPQSTTQESMFSYVRLSDGGPARFEGPRSEVAVLAEIAERVLGAGGPVNWRDARDHNHLRGLIAKLIPGMEQIADIGQTRKEFAIPGRQPGAAEFAAPSRKAQFRAEPIPTLPALGPRDIRIMTVRSESQFNTVVYEEHDLYRGQDRRDVILMSADDLSRLGLKPDQRVRVHNSTGEMHVFAREWDIAHGCALMYGPEANLLVGRAVDARSRTPAFKSIVASVDPV